MKKIMWGLALIIIPAFVLWGSGSAIRGGKAKYAGKIFGRKISFRQYEQSLRAARNQALLIYGDNLANVAPSLDLEQEAWQRLIILHQAKQAKIKVSNQEVIEFIAQIPLFQKQGRFDQERYQMLLDYAFRANPREFEEQIREALMIDNLRLKVIEQITVTDEEVNKVYQLEHEQAKAVYVFIDPNVFSTEIHPAYEELQEYYRQANEQFRKPEQVNVEYLALYFPQPPAEENLSEEGQEQQRKILENKMWDVFDGIDDEQNASFSELAQQNQLQAAETGLFSAEEAVPEIGLSYEFLNAAFSLPPGSLSNVITTSKGYFIIRVKEKLPPYIPQIEEITQELEQAVIKQKSWQMAQEQGEQTLEQIKTLIQEDGLSFSEAAKSLGLTIAETEQFSRTANYIAGIGQSREFAQAAFGLEPGEVSHLITVPNGYCILSLKEIIPIDEEVFAEKREEFSEQLLARKKELTFQIWLSQVNTQANLESNIEQLKNSP